ncbi:MAG TPA: GNAT family N-acetyltransferase [Pseudonocardiaceae bacterium]|jgi:GNAT superfamily N-acetyltransferase
MTRLNPPGTVLPGLSAEALRVEAAAALGWQAPQQAWIAVADGWAGVTAMEVRRDQRGRGLGTAILTALAEAARHQGADRMYLQVEIDNTCAPD